MRFAWLVDGDEGFGAARKVMNLTRQVAAHGNEVSIVALGGGRLVEQLRDGGNSVYVLGVPRPPVEGNLSEKARSAIYYSWERHVRKNVAWALREARADVVIVIAAHLVYLAGWAARTSNAMPVWELASDVGAESPFGLSPLFLRRAAKTFGVLTIANSRHNRRTLGRMPNVIVVYPGTDTSRFVPIRMDEASSSLGMGSPSCVRFAIVARLHEEKGQSILLRAVAELESRGSLPPCEILIVGGPHGTSYHRRLRAMAATLESRVMFVGTVADPGRYMAAAHFTVNARTSAEPFGRSIVESMLMERPVLAHSLGGPSEILDPGRTGWLYPGGDTGSLKTGLSRALDDAHRWQEMGRQARQVALRMFSLERQFGQFSKALACHPKAEANYSNLRS